MLKQDHTELSYALYLLYAIKSPNYIVGDKGLVLSMFVFRVTLSLGYTTPNLKYQILIYNILKSAVEEAVTIAAYNLLKCKLRKKIPLSRSVNLSTGQNVMIIAKIQRKLFKYLKLMHKIPEVVWEVIVICHVNSSVRS